MSLQPFVGFLKSRSGEAEATSVVKESKKGAKTQHFGIL